MSEELDREVEEWLKSHPDPPTPTAIAAPPVVRRRISVAMRVIRGLQGLCFGTISAILLDQVVGLATPITNMAWGLLLGAWIWPERRTLALRAVCARSAACAVVALALGLWSLHW